MFVEIRYGNPKCFGKVAKESCESHDKTQSSVDLPSTTCSVSMHMSLRKIFFSEYIKLENPSLDSETQ